MDSGARAVAMVPAWATSPATFTQAFLRLAVEPASARVFVGGQDTARNHIMGLVTPGSGEFEVLANLTSVLRDVFGGTSVFVPATNELWFELDLDIMILNLATKKVEVLPVSASYEILGMSLDPSTGVVVGLGGGPGQPGRPRRQPVQRAGRGRLER
jgi:hypothetical protein